MADPLSINAKGVDISRWKQMTAQEIIREEKNGAEIPPEIMTWAQQMAAFAKIPDDVTYEEVDGDVGLDALDKLGISPEEAGVVPAENAEEPTETEDPDAVTDPERDAEVTPETPDENIFATATPGQAADTKPPEDAPDEDQLTLSDTAIVADNDEIRKRKERKGLR